MVYFNNLFTVHSTPGYSVFFFCAKRENQYQPYHPVPCTALHLMSQQCYLQISRATHSTTNYASAQSRYSFEARLNDERHWKCIVYYVRNHMCSNTNTHINLSRQLIHCITLHVCFHTSPTLSLADSSSFLSVNLLTTGGVGTHMHTYTLTVEELLITFKLFRSRLSCRPTDTYNSFSQLLVRCSCGEQP